MVLKYLNFYELVTAFFIGMLLLFLLCFFLKIKQKNVLLLCLNSLSGAIIYFILAFVIKINIISLSGGLFFCGFTGIIGCLVILLLNML